MKCSPHSCIRICGFWYDSSDIYFILICLHANYFLIDIQHSVYIEMIWLDLCDTFFLFVFHWILFVFLQYEYPSSQIVSLKKKKLEQSISWLFSQLWNQLKKVMNENLISSSLDELPDYMLNMWCYGWT